MGLFQHKYESWKESVEFGDSRAKVVLCEFCGESFSPDSPNQKRHSRAEDDDLNSIICADERWKAKLSTRGYVERVCGMTISEFIETYGREVFESL